MIKTSEIWDEIEKHGLSDYVSRYEIWIKPKELREFLSNHKVIKKSGTIGVYIIIFLYFLAFLAGFGYIYQGMIEERGDREVVGIIIVIIGFLALYFWITRRYTGMEFILDDGLLTGIPYTKIRKIFDVSLTYIPYQYVNSINLENMSSDLAKIKITTKDGKCWASFPQDKDGGLVIAKRKSEDYLSMIIDTMERAKNEADK